VIICTGALEQQAIFHNNDLPGVMMSSAAQRLIHLYGIRPGRAAVIVTGNNDGYANALDLVDAGVEVKAIIDLRDTPVRDAITKAVAAHGVRILTGHAVFAAQKTDNHLSGVEIRPITSMGICGPQSESIQCDLLCMAVGYTPTYQLVCQAGGQLSYDDSSAMFTLTNCPDGLQVAGSVNSHWDLDVCLAEASRAAIIATNALGFTEVAVPEMIAKVGFINVGPQTATVQNSYRFFKILILRVVTVENHERNNPMLNQLTRQQVETAMQVLDQSVRVDGEPKPLQVPMELSHLTEKEWDALAEGLASLVMEQARATVH
jgi:hypothetical protein